MKMVKDIRKLLFQNLESYRMTENWRKIQYIYLKQCGYIAIIKSDNICNNILFHL